MLPTIVTGFAAFYGGQPLFSSPPRSRACVAHHMGEVHLMVTQKSVDFKDSTRRFNYVTPKSFLEFIDFYKVSLRFEGCYR